MIGSILLEAVKFSKQSADGKHLTRSEFRALLADALDSGRVGFLEVAGEFQVSISTILNWSSGIYAPHPNIRRAVIDYVHGRRCLAVASPLTRGWYD